MGEWRGGVQWNGQLGTMSLGVSGKARLMGRSGSDIKLGFIRLSYLLSRGLSPPSPKFLSIFIFSLSLSPSCLGFHDKILYTGLTINESYF